MTTQPSPLDTLLELARTRTDRALAELGDALTASRNAEERLALLQRYRDEYGARFAQSTASGISITELRNYQVFIEKLQLAIEHQSREVESRRQGVGARAEGWRAARQTENAFDTLQARREQRAKIADERQQQKTTDEAASRFALNRSNGS